MSRRDWKSWTPEEDRMLQRLYYTVGADRTAELITERFGHPRSAKACNLRMRRVGRTLGYQPGWVPLVDIHPEGNGRRAAPRLLKAAKLDGVARTIRSTGGLTVIVPEAWAEEYLQRLERDRQFAVEHASWMRTDEVARLFDTVPKMLSRAVMGHEASGALIASVRRIRKVRHPLEQCRPRLWHPDDVRREARAYRTWRAKRHTQEAAA